MKDKSYLKPNLDNINRKRFYRRRKSDLRVFLEALLMLFVGFNLLIFLNSIPEKFKLSVFVVETVSNISEGFVQLYNGLLQIGAATSVIFLLILCIFLFLGGIVRCLRLVNNSIKRMKKKSYK